MNSTLRGADFEKRVFSFFEAEVKANRLFFNSEYCAIFRQKPYYSRDRQSLIVFDVAIEASLPGAQTPSMLCLIECKDYSHPVRVDEVEEFFTKVQQVASAKSKAIIVTSSSFQSGALEFARSKGIGLLRMFPESGVKWVLHRSPSSTRMSSELSKDSEIWSGLTKENYYSHRFDFFCNAGDTFTYSLYDFFLALASDTFGPSLQTIAAERNDADLVPFMSPDDVELPCQAVHSAIGYQNGSVSLRAICEWQQLVTGLTVVTGAVARREEAERGILGRITFNPPSIVIFSDPMGVRRERFTLAHELGHLILGHSEYMQAESVDAKDIEDSDRVDIGADSIRRLEWQANRFASCLLLPREPFVKSAYEKACQMGLRNKGFGLIYFDHQPVNTQNYYELTSALAATYEVSRSAVRIRLKNFDLLCDSSTQGKDRGFGTTSRSV